MSGGNRPKLRANLLFLKWTRDNVDRDEARGMYGSRLAGVFVAVAVSMLTLIVASVAADEPCPPSLVERQRSGFVAIRDNWSQIFDVEQLGAGWYLDFWPYTDPPDGMDRAFSITKAFGPSVDPDILGPLVDDNPGVLWVIGSEPDSIHQDELLPEEYARLYHDVYLFIKNRDRTSQIAAGGIVQPTPLRLEYLDLVLAAYEARYGQAMPVDLWHIHNAILPEVKGHWGADIPPGIDATQGVIRQVEDNDNMDIFRSQIWDFRQWMADRGYLGYPLVVTEYGILMPDAPDLGFYFDEGRVNAFMSATFEFFQNTTDPVLGDPTDGHRLVQRWAWFSLDYPPFDPSTWEGFNGNLFDPDTTELTGNGQHYASHTASFPSLEYVDLGLVAWDLPRPPLIVSPTETISHSVRVRIGNRGTADSGAFTVTLSHDGPVSDTLSQSLANLTPVSSQWLTFTLTGLQVGAYTLSVEIDPGDQVSDTARCNNLATRSILIPTHRVHLPRITHHRAEIQLGDDGEGAVNGQLPRRSGPSPAYLAPAPGSLD